MKQLNLFFVLTQVTGAVFAIFAFGITMLYSTVGAPGGSLLSVLKTYPVYQLPFQLLGGLFLVLILISLGLYAKAMLRS